MRPVDDDTGFRTCSGVPHSRWPDIYWRRPFSRTGYFKNYIFQELYFSRIAFFKECPFQGFYFLRTTFSNDFLFKELFFQGPRFKDTCLCAAYFPKTLFFQGFYQAFSNLKPSYQLSVTRNGADERLFQHPSSLLFQQPRSWFPTFSSYFSIPLPLFANFSPKILQLIQSPFFLVLCSGHGDAFNPTDIILADQLIQQYHDYGDRSMEAASGHDNFRLAGPRVCNDP